MPARKVPMPPFSPRPAVVMLPEELTSARRPVLERLLTEHLPPPGQDLILDLTVVRVMDTGGLRLLVTCLRALTEQGSALALACARPDVFQVAHLVGAAALFDRHATVPDAMRSLEARSGAPC